MTIKADLRTSFLLARRAHFFSIALWLLLAVLGMALLGALFSGRQPATVALDVGLSAMRLLLPILVILLVQELLSREFDRRYILSSLTYPRPRHQLLLGRALTVLLLIYTLLAVMAISLGYLTVQIGLGYAQSTPVALGLPYLITIAHIGVDLFVLTALATLLAIVASTPAFVLIGTLGFMLIARSYAPIIALLERERYVVENPELYQQSLGLLGYLLPDLSAMDVRMISLYGQMELLPGDWLASLLANLAYGLALLALALFALHRKRFN